MSFGATLDLTLRPSLRALGAVFVLHVLVVLLTLVSAEPGWPWLPMAGLLGLSWLRLRRHPVFGFGSGALTRLTGHPDGSWTLHDARGTPLEAELDDRTFSHARLLVLNFRLKSGGRRTRVLTGDELEPDQWRRLRARLASA